MKGSSSRRGPIQPDPLYSLSKRRIIKKKDAMNFADIYTRPTESESFEDPEDEQSNGGFSHQSSDSSDRGFELPSGYRSPSSSPPKKKGSPLPKSSSANSLSMKMTGIDDEDRLLMLAKHPNVSEDHVVTTLIRQQQAQALRDQQRESQRPQMRQASSERPIQHSQVRFSPAFPIDADTGEAWDSQTARRGNLSTKTSKAGGGSNNAAETSFDKVWSSDVDSEQQSAPEKKSFFSGVWSKIFPSSSSAPDRDDSVISKQDANMSISMASDKTPKTSNVDVKARAKRIRQQTGYLTLGDHWERFQHKLFHTKEGWIVLGLLVILLLAILATVVAALASTSDDTSVNSNPLDNAGAGRPTPDDFWTLPPTSSPTAAATMSISMRGTTTVPRPQPTTSTPPTVEPTWQPTTIDLIELAATASPTSSPATGATDKPTLPPTARPTLRLTASPTTAPVLSTASPTVWTFLGSPPLTEVGASLVGSDTEQRFGQAVSLSADGLVLAVGSPFATIDTKVQAGMVQVYEWSDANGGAWQPRGVPILGRNQGDKFGSDVALNGDGSVLIASEPTYSGAAGNRSGNVRAFMYTLVTGGLGSYVSLGQELSGTAASDHFGISLAITADGRRIAVGAPYHDNGESQRNISGQVMVFDYIANDTPGGTWQARTPMAGTDQLDWFGSSVDLDSDGNIMCVGAPRNIVNGGYVKCYDLTTNEVMGGLIKNEIEPLRYDDNFGAALKVSGVSGTYRVAIGAPGKNNKALDDGMVTVYQWNVISEEWSVIGAPIVADVSEQGDKLGFAVDLQEDILVVASPGRDTVDRYVLQDSRWERHPATLLGVDGSVFGYAVRQQGDRLAIGSPGINDESGMVNVYTR